MRYLERSLKTDQNCENFTKHNFFAVPILRNGGTVKNITAVRFFYIRESLKAYEVRGALKRKKEMRLTTESLAGLTASLVLRRLQILEGRPADWRGAVPLPPNQGFVGMRISSLREAKISLP